MQHMEESSASATLLTIEGAAARRGCSGSTIWRAIRDGRLKPKRVLGRVVLEPAEVDAMSTPLGGGRWRHRTSVEKPSSTST
jgi:predicted DNA-binding transcriptional regulator AlpA